MSRARLTVKRVVEFSEEEKLDLNLWQVPTDKDYEEGVKYSINYRVFVNGKWVEKIRIDNKERHGHHVHFLGAVKPYEFVSFEKALRDIKRLIKKLKEGE